MSPTALQSRSCVAREGAACARLAPVHSHSEAVGRIVQQSRRVRSPFREDVRPAPCSAVEFKRRDHPISDRRLFQRGWFAGEEPPEGQHLSATAALTLSHPRRAPRTPHSPAVLTVYPDGTVKSDGSGSACRMLVSSMSVVPKRGSLVFISTGTFKSVEIHVVRTIVMV